MSTYSPLNHIKAMHLLFFKVDLLLSSNVEYQYLFVDYDSQAEYYGK